LQDDSAEIRPAKEANFASMPEKDVLYRLYHQMKQPI
jgi:hypothetical protein